MCGRICHTIMDQLDTDKQTRDMVDRAAHHAKADLVSQMVGELPSLQGTMGVVALCLTTPMFQSPLLIIINLVLR